MIFIYLVFRISVVHVETCPGAVFPDHCCDASVCVCVPQSMPKVGFSRNNTTQKQISHNPHPFIGAFFVHLVFGMSVIHDQTSTRPDHCCDASVWVCECNKLALSSQQRNTKQKKVPLCTHSLGAYISKITPCRSHGPGQRTQAPNAALAGPRVATKPTHAGIHWRKTSARRDLHT